MTVFALLSCVVFACDSNIAQPDVGNANGWGWGLDTNTVNGQPWKRRTNTDTTWSSDSGTGSNTGTDTNTGGTSTGDTGGTGGTDTAVPPDTTTTSGSGGTTTDTTGGTDTGTTGGTDTGTTGGTDTGTTGGTTTDPTGGTDTGTTGGTNTGTTGGTDTGTTGGTTTGTGGTDTSTGTGTGTNTGTGTGGTGTNTGTNTGTSIPTGPTAGIWMSAAEIAALPTSGSAWSGVKSEADKDCGTPNLADQEQRNNVCVMAKALVYARIGGSSYRDGVVRAIQSVVSSGTYGGRALALGRELGAYAIAADLIGLQSVSPSLDTQFRAKLRELLRAPTTEAGTLVECNERRPNNWGTHCGGSRAAVAAYLGDRAELDRVAKVFRGWLGDRSSFAGFSYGDLSWQCNQGAPMGINPTGCMKDGHDIGGVLPDDQRRAGSFSWPAPHENYVYEALQGALLQAVILSRSGYDVWNWQDKALLRAFRWLYEVSGFQATGDDVWQIHVINHYYGTSFPASSPTQPGKNVGWTDWTHR